MFLMYRSHSTLPGTECRFRIAFHARVELTWVSDSLVPSWDCGVERAACWCTTLQGVRRMRELSAELHSKEMENAAVAGELNSGVGLKELPQEDVGSLWEPNLEDMGSLWTNPGEWGSLWETNLEDRRTWRSWPWKMGGVYESRTWRMWGACESGHWGMWGGMLSGPWAVIGSTFKNYLDYVLSGNC